MQTMGELQPVGQAEAGCWPVGSCLQLSMGNEEASGRSPARYSAGVEDPQTGGGEAAPPHRASHFRGKW